MADIARDAFASRNYRLAAEIYERCLKENPATMDVHYGYADSLAKCGKFREALDVYSHCYRKARANAAMATVSPEQLRHVVSALLEAIMSSPAHHAQQKVSKAVDPLVCGLCEGVLNVPVTLLCGHSVCRKCELKDKSRSCRRCGQPKQHQKSLETNVLVKSLVEKWWPKELKAAQLRDEGNEMFQKGEMEAALLKYNEAWQCAPNDPLVLSNRSNVLLHLSRAQSALQDADHVTKLRPTWGKGHYRRGMALTSLGRHEEALLALCSCVALDRNPQAVRHELAPILHRLLLPSLRAREHCISNASAAPYWLGASRRGSMMSGQNSFSLFRAMNSRSVNRGSSDCEDNSSGEEDLMSQGPRSPHAHQVQHSLLAHPLQSNPRLHSILDQLFQTVEKIKRLDKNSGEEEGWLKAVSCQVEASDFDCILCCRTVWRPVSTPCGHTYCWMCLDRCLDYSHACPLCMAPLAEYLSSSQRSVTEFVDRALRVLLPREWSSRQLLHEQELQVAGPERNPCVPVFVCTTAFPSVSCPLFVYEPRYRLMIRRAVESGSGQFGIAACVDNTTTGQHRYAEFGTMLEIRDWMVMSNGCSIMSTVGMRRFRTLGRGEMDGYDMANVEFLKDETVQSEFLLSLRKLHDLVRQKAQFWVSTLQAEPQMEIERTFGVMPVPEDDWSSLPDGPSWTWWLLAILPLGTKLKVGILGTTSLEKRLRAIDKTLDHIARQMMACTASHAPQSSSQTVETSVHHSLA